MSSLHPRDRVLHYEDGSHRWAGGPHGTSRAAWESRVRAHQAEHLAELQTGPVPGQRATTDKTARGAGGNR